MYMKRFQLLLFFMVLSITISAQEVVPLPFVEIPEVTFDRDETQYFSKLWGTTVVTNVSKPTLTVYEPTAEKKTGTSVIIAPGGGLYALSVNSEGTDVANWLVTKGITAFILKYRLVPTGEDGVAEINELGQKNPMQLMKNVAQVMPYSVVDGLNAVEYVRTNAQKYGLDPNKIGFMGFSAGGAVSMGVTYNSETKNQPNFLVPVYPWTTAMPVQTPSDNAPPMLIICATDDALGLAQGAIDLYTSWFKAQKNVALHMYSKGDHGFGMRIKGFPSDHWIERFYEWARVEGLVKY